MADLIQYRRPKNRGDIDLTSLVDVVFLLLIFFLVTSQFAQPTASLELPTGSPGAKPDESAIRIEVTENGELQVDGVIVEDADFVLALEQAIATSDTRKARFYGDRRIDYGKFVDLLDRARSAGIEDFSIVKSAELENAEPADQ